MRYTKHRLLFVVAVAAPITALLAACSEGSSIAPTALRTLAPAAPATPAAVIDQRDLQFVPATVTVKVGETVLITSSDPALHNVRIDSTTVAATMKKGDSATWVAPAPGEYRVTCDYHPLMLATIVVTR